MSYKIRTLSTFDKEVKKLAKKYPSLKNDLNLLAIELLKNPELGVHLGQNFYKIRMAITSKGKGKSAGARIISFFKIVDNTIYLTSIYDKSDKNSISEKEITGLINQIEELN